MENGKNPESGNRTKFAMILAAMVASGCCQDYKITPEEAGPVLTECNNGIDDDMDGDVDGWDGDCTGAWDTTEGADPEDAPYVEYETRECGDGEDNDGDGWTDEQDPGCWANVTTDINGQLEEVYTYLAGDNDESKTGYQE